MKLNGPVVVIEDDIDDQELLAMVFEKLNYNNKIMFFNDGQAALDFLNNAIQYLLLFFPTSICLNWTVFP